MLVLLLFCKEVIFYAIIMLCKGALRQLKQLLALAIHFYLNLPAALSKFINVQP